MMEVSLILVMLVLTETGGTTEEGEDGSLPVWRVSPDEESPAPQFRTVHQLVQVQPDQTASLECTLANVDSSVTVSWLRWADMSVLSVGGLVFSSDPRLRVVVTKLSPSAVSWTLHIAHVQAGDSGDYQCQVNTEPKQSLDVTLSVDGNFLKQSELRYKEEGEVFSVFDTERFGSFGENRREKFFSFNNKEAGNYDEASDEVTEERNAGLNQFEGLTSDPINHRDDIIDTFDRKDDTIDTLDKKDEIFGKFDKEDETSSSSNEPHRDKKDQHFPNTPASATDILNIGTDRRDTVSRDVERKSIFSVLQQSYIPVAEENFQTPAQSLTDQEPALPQRADFDTFEGDKLQKILQRSAMKSDQPVGDEGDDEPETDQSLLIPLLALSLIAGLTLALAACRLCHDRFLKDKESPEARSPSRSGTLRSSSRRSSRGEERWREGEQLEEKVERMLIKPRLSPLIEVIEPTPPLCRNAPIFGMTGLNENDYELDISEVTTIASDTESVERYEIYKAQVKTFQSSESPDGEQRPGRTRLINNVNTFL